MQVCWFLTCHSSTETGAADSLTASELECLQQLLVQTPGLSELRLHTPGAADDPMLDDGAPPVLTVQLFFDDVAVLEQALAPDGYLQQLASFEPVARFEASQQTMLVRAYPVAGQTLPDSSRQVYCTYLVCYEGPAQDTAAWLWHYLNGHPQLMAQLPGIRHIEIYSRLDWCGSLPWPRADAMQRNQVVFSSGQALTAALQTPLRAQMREHFQDLPAFSGGVTHFPVNSIRQLASG